MRFYSESKAIFRQILIAFVIKESI